MYLNLHLFLHLYIYNYICIGENAFMAFTVFLRVLICCCSDLAATQAWTLSASSRASRLISYALFR